MTSRQNKSVLNTTKNKIIALILFVVSIVHFTGALADTGTFIIYICQNYKLEWCKILKTRQQMILDRKQELKISDEQFYTTVDTRFYDLHPELNKRSLNPKDPQDKQLIFQWWDIAEKFLDEEEKKK
ncbi:MAG TPA: hypothetical protein V6C58_21140 [Allocoleopsis sp.]